MVRVKVPETDLIRLVLCHLQRSNLIQSMRILEKESQSTLIEYGKDIAFFRHLILDGLFTEVKLFLQPLKSEYSTISDFNRALYYINKQIFLEKCFNQNLTSSYTASLSSNSLGNIHDSSINSLHVENNNNNSNGNSNSKQQQEVSEVVKALKDLEDVATKDEFRSLCYGLSLPSLKSHPEYSNWDIYTGRMETFENCLKYLQQIFPNQIPSQVTDPGMTALLSDIDPLLTLSKQALLYQILEFKKKGNVFSYQFPSEITANIFKDKWEPPKINQKMKQEQRQNTTLDDGIENYATTSISKPPHTLSPPLHYFDIKNTLVSDDDKNLHDDNLKQAQDRGGSSKIFASPPVSSINGNNTKIQNYGPHHQVESSEVSLNQYYNPVQKSKGKEEKRKPVAWEISADPDARPQDTLYLSSPPRHERPGLNTREAYKEQKRQADLEKERAKKTFEKEDYYQVAERLKFMKENNHSEIEKVRPQTQSHHASPERRNHQPIPIDYASLKSTDLYSFEPSVIVQESHPIRCASFCPNGSLLAYGTNNGTLRLIDFDADSFNGDYTKNMTGGPANINSICHERSSHHRGSIYCLSWDTTGTLLASGSNDKHIRVVSILNEGKTKPSSIYSLEGEDIIIRGHTGTVRDLHFNPSPSSSASLLISGGGGDNVVRLWDVKSPMKDPVLSLHGHNSTVFKVRQLSSGQEAISAGEDGFIRIWDLREGSCVRQINTLRPIVGMNAIGNDGSEIIVSFQDGSFEIWEKQSAQCIKRGKHFKEEARTIDISPQVSKLNNMNNTPTLQHSQPKLFVVSGSYDSTVMVSAVQQNYSPIFIRKGHRSKVLSTQWHPLRPSFISTSADNSILYWSPRNENNLNTE